MPADRSDGPQRVTLAELALHEMVSRFEGRDYGSQVSAFVSRNRPGTGAELHHHPYEETFIVLEGRSTFSVDGATVEAEAGEIVVVPAGAVHGFVSSGEGTLLQISIHPCDHVIQERDEG
jgi:mannose-6-phosphate isomerase-like protein (cupin superfamily)